jgi:hypothetical protein
LILPLLKESLPVPGPTPEQADGEHAVTVWGAMLLSVQITVSPEWIVRFSGEYAKHPVPQSLIDTCQFLRTTVVVVG